MRIQLTVALGSLLAFPAQAADVTVSVQIPQLKVAEYHRPYVAVFVEGAGGQHAANLAVWYLSKDTSLPQLTARIHALFRRLDSLAAPQARESVFRLRGLTLELREREYVAAAKMRGESSLYIMLAEILPNARGPLIVDMCLRMGYTIVLIGVLGFLGIGLPPPDPDWGGMVKETYGMMSVWPHMALVPCVAISSLVVGFSLLAVGLRELGLRD